MLLSSRAYLSKVLMCGVYSMFRIPPSQLLRFPLPLRLRTLLLSGNDIMSLGFHLPLSMLSSCGFSYANIYIFFSTFGKLAMEYLPLAKTLALGWPYALGTLLLALVYQAMSKYLSDEPYHRVGGAFWIVQMWLFAYFLDLSVKDFTSFKTFGLYVVHSLPTMPSDDLMSFF